MGCSDDESPCEEDLGRAWIQSIRSAIAGDRTAQTELFEGLRNYLFLVANESLAPSMRGKVGASDVVQQSLLKATQELGHFRGQTEEEFRGWMRTILINEVRLVHRSFSTDKRNIHLERPIDRDVAEGAAWLGRSLVDGNPTPRALALTAERAQYVRRLIEQMPESYRQVIHLRHWEEMTFEEIARHLSMTTSGVAKIWCRALIELQRLYQNDESHVRE